MSISLGTFQSLTCMTPLIADELRALLRSGPVQWNAWRNSARAHVVDLRGTDLSGIALQGANLARCNLHGACLESADLRGADLQHADLVRARLFRADLSDANLRGADMRSAYLARATLDGADLSNTSLHAANLQGASLRRANLEFCLLIRCDVRGTNLRQAICGGTTFAQLRLSEAKGLQSAVHRRPSSIGAETLALSHPHLPIAFLRGCGIEDDMLGLLSTLRTSDVARFFSVFISYSHQDRSFARRLHEGLQQMGVRCWLDERQMRPGDDIYERIEEGIRQNDRILLCASRHSLSSWWVDAEIESAFAKERESHKAAGGTTRVLIPIDLDGYLFSDAWTSGKRRLLQARVAANFTEPATFDAQLRRLRSALTKPREAESDTATPSMSRDDP